MKNRNTINSLSGGKTSSFIAVNYPADYEIFSLVCIDEPKAAPKDKNIIQRVNDKIFKHSPIKKEFIATAEDDKILKVVFDLEQKIGREIIWVRGNSFDEVIKEKRAIPNQQKRFCTTFLKLNPMFWYWFLRIGTPCNWRIGFRFDEQERAKNFTNEFKFNYSTNNFGNKRKNWKTMEFRNGEFPLIENKIDHFQIYKFWKNENIDFPEDSNCQNCFWKPIQQLRKNWDNSPEKMQWAANMENKINRKFKETLTMQQISRVPLQLDFNFGTGSGCNAGFCTD